MAPGELARVPEPLEWMTGRWMSEEGGRVTEELRTAPRRGSLLGVSRTCPADRMVAFEYLRIEEGPEGVTYLASPQGRQPPTPFRLVEHGAARAVFENPDHDFPQRIIYWREGDRLSARVEGRQGGEPLSAQWSWRRTD